MSVGKLLGEALGLTERRQHPRSEQPELTLRFGGQEYTAIDWSLGGCRINGDTAQFQVKQRIQGRMRLEGADGRGEFLAEVVRIVENGDVGLRWLELSPYIFMSVTEPA